MYRPCWDLSDQDYYHRKSQNLLRWHRWSSKWRWIVNLYNWTETNCNRVSTFHRNFWTNKRNFKVRNERTRDQQTSGVVYKLDVKTQRVQCKHLKEFEPSSVFADEIFPPLERYKNQCCRHLPVEVNVSSTAWIKRHERFAGCVWDHIYLWGSFSGEALRQQDAKKFPPIPNYWWRRQTRGKLRKVVHLNAWW